MNDQYNYIVRISIAKLLNLPMRNLEEFKASNKTLEASVLKTKHMLYVQKYFEYNENLILNMTDQCDDLVLVRTF
jgi:hypothetical protein